MHLTVCSTAILQQLLYKNLLGNTVKDLAKLQEDNIHFSHLIHLAVRFITEAKFPLVNLCDSLMMSLPFVFWTCVGSPASITVIAALDIFSAKFCRIGILPFLGVRELGYVSTVGILIEKSVSCSLLT